MYERTSLTRESVTSQADTALVDIYKVAGFAACRPYCIIK